MSPEYSGRFNPRCLKVLVPVDRNQLNTAFGLILASDTLCNKSLSKLQSMMNAGKIYKGDSLIADRKDNRHDAGTSSDLKIIHVDEDYLASNPTARNLGMLMVHEGWHAAGYANHPPGDPPYTTFPYDQAERCVP